jgi:hypothetical protein
MSAEPEPQRGPRRPEHVRVAATSGSEPLRRIYRRFLSDADQLAHFTCAGYEHFPEAERAIGARAWRARAANEYGSIAQFAQLQHRLTLLGAPLEIVGTAARLIRDECRHAGLCQAMADALDGGQAPLKVPRHQLALQERQDDPWLAVAGSILTACCLGEAVSINGYRGIAAVCDDDSIAAAADGIADDEVVHAQFGWETLSWVLRHGLRPASRRAFDAFVSRQLAAFEHACGGSPQMAIKLAGQTAEFSRRPGNLGVLPREEYLILFYSSLSTVVFPRLDALGLDGTMAWQRRPNLTSS